jgi:hypothetical protein
MNYFFKRPHIISSRFFQIRNDATIKNSEKPQIAQKNDVIGTKFEEVQYPLPWEGGTMAGKWWGPKSSRPIICLHENQVHMLRIKSNQILSLFITKMINKA